MENLDIKNHFVVDRSRWLRGEGAEKSYLQRSSDGKRCCLGFACLQIGERMQDSIEDVPVFIGRLGPWRPAGDSQLQLLNAMMHVNDAFVATDPADKSVVPDTVYENAREFTGIMLAELGMSGPIVDDVDRERRLTALFQRAGLEIEFVDGPVVEGGAP